MKDFIFSITASLFLATLLRKWISPDLVFLKSRHFTEQVFETIFQIEGAYSEIIFKTYGQFGEMFGCSFTN